MTTIANAPSIEAETLVTVVGEVFAGLFGEDRGRPYECDIADDATSLTVTSSVTVTGGWDCTVSVHCSLALATTAAAELLGIDPADVAEDDLRDVAGEFANVVGGNVKSIMPGPSVLSLPVTDSSYVGVAGSGVGLSVDLSWCREPLRVALTNPTASGRATADVSTQLSTPEGQS